jgi:hypothetical protein
MSLRFAFAAEAAKNLAVVASTDAPAAFKVAVRASAVISCSESERISAAYDSCSSASSFFDSSEVANRN